MPCWNVIQARVEFGVVEFDLERQGNLNRFKEAVRNLDYEVMSVTENSFNFYHDGRVAYFSSKGLRVEKGYEYIAADMKKEYSRIVIKEMAKKNRWNLEEKKDSKFVATKRRWA